MRLEKLEYKEFEGTEREWAIEGLTLGQINLIVGKNSTGKTRTLNVINGFAGLLSGGPLRFASGNYTADFCDTDANEKIKYSLQYQGNRVVSETLQMGRKKLLTRGAGGKGRIDAKQLDKKIQFQAPDTELACVARRDSVQHPFFESLHQWGSQVVHFAFSTQLGRDNYLVKIDSDENNESSFPSIKNSGSPVTMFLDGQKKFGAKFVADIQQDMQRLGYELDRVGASVVPNLSAKNGVPNDVIGLYVKEAEVIAKIFQKEMSQGMFRAFSLIIQFEYMVATAIPECVIIDDIGEGLDFSRSSALISLLIDKAVKHDFQLIMSTNDRFVMNHVPLEYWSVIKREGSRCSVINYVNAKQHFEEFKYTGLSNFDFLSTNFFEEGLSGE